MIFPEHEQLIENIYVSYENIDCVGGLGLHGRVASKHYIAS